MVLIGGLIGPRGRLWARGTWSSVIAYPLNIGGRPLHSMPPFIVPAYETTILFASLAAVIGMIVLNGLPMPYHPVFNVPRFAAASSDGFFLTHRDGRSEVRPARARASSSTGFTRWECPTLRLSVAPERVSRLQHIPARVCMLVACALSLGAGAACRQDMHDQPKIKAYREADFFARRPRACGRSPRTPSRAGSSTTTIPAYTGKVNGQFTDEFPFQVTREVLQRGHDRFSIYCTPCHGQTGMGNGMVVQRGFRPPPSFHTETIRKQTVGYWFDVMTNGFGAMPDYRAQVAPEDRWAIAAYIRALQLSQRATSGRRAGRPDRASSTRRRAHDAAGGEPPGQRAAPRTEDAASRARCGAERVERRMTGARPAAPRDNSTWSSLPTPPAPRRQPATAGDGRRACRPRALRRRLCSRTASSSSSRTCSPSCSGSASRSARSRFDGAPPLGRRLGRRHPPRARGGEPHAAVHGAAVPADRLRDARAVPLDRCRRGGAGRHPAAQGAVPERPVLPRAGGDLLRHLVGARASCCRGGRSSRNATATTGRRSRCSG